MTETRGRIEYGLDAPGLCLGFLVSGAVALSMAGLMLVFFSRPPFWALGLAALLLLAALYLLGMGLLMLRWSKIIKVRERDSLLDQIVWRGDEQVLDAGCGRGLMLIGAALRLTTGSVTGIDIWQVVDQSGNSPDAARENARLAGVANRVIIRTADMRQLPFADQCFDCVLTHWAIHNLAAEPDRVQALREMDRVLRPGGTLLLADIANRDAYIDHLRTLGFEAVTVLVSPWRDRILAVLSFGSFRPAAILARKPDILPR